MNLTNLRKYTKMQLIDKLRKVILLNSEKSGNPIYVYKDALIDLREIKVRDLVPLQLYQLRSSNQLVSSLYKTFQKKYSEDIFNMGGYYTYEADSKKYAFIPPIVEYVENSKGETQSVVIDGLHRILLAKELKKETISVVIIENIPQELILPVVPNRWEEMALVETAPKNENKRKWLVPPEEGYLYYRNFQSVFQNIGKPRVSNLDPAKRG